MWHRTSPGCRAHSCTPSSPDLDGFIVPVNGLENYGHVQHLADALTANFGADVARQIGRWYRNDNQQIEGSKPQQQGIHTP
jgi:hypothetical protein